MVLFGDGDQPVWQYREGYFPPPCVTQGELAHDEYPLFPICELSLRAFGQRFSRETKGATCQFQPSSIVGDVQINRFESQLFMAFMHALPLSHRGSAKIYQESMFHLGGTGGGTHSISPQEPGNSLIFHVLLEETSHFRIWLTCSSAGSAVASSWGLTALPPLPTRVLHFSYRIQAPTKRQTPAQSSCQVT